MATEHLLTTRLITLYNMTFVIFYFVKVYWSHMFEIYIHSAKESSIAQYIQKISDYKIRPWKEKNITFIYTELQFCRAPNCNINYLGSESPKKNKESWGLNHSCSGVCHLTTSQNMPVIEIRGIERVILQPPEPRKCSGQLVYGSRHAA